jgi:signal transduction histidine kinase
VTRQPDSSLFNLVAHEMRGPVTVIRGYLSLLREGALLDLGEVARVMDAKAEELDALADILVSAGRLEFGETLRKPIVFDLHEAVATAVERVEARAQLEGATVQVLPAGHPICVHADRCQTARVLTNLLGNALTYSRPPAEVAVEVRASSPAEVAVHDRGVGIPDEMRERVFERFSRYAEPGASQPAGLGLGLAISRELATQNGGELLLERSAPGQGSTFVLRLPVVTETEEGTRWMHRQGR